MNSIRSLLLGTTLALAACGSRPVDEADFERALSQRLSSQPEWASDATVWRATRIAYARNGGELLWLGNAHPTRAGETLASVVASAADDALDPARYDVRAPLALQPAGVTWPFKRYEPRAAADADVRLTYAAASYAHDLAYGVVPRDALGKDWVAASDSRAAASVGRLVQAAARGDTEKLLRGAAPRHAQYARLRAALANLRAVDLHGGWLPVPLELRVKPGKADPAIEQLRARLVADGDLPAAAASGTTLDEPLQEAVKHVQRRYGLTADGVPGKSTLAALNVAASDRVREVELAMERWRWLPRKLGERHVLVNIPTFELMGRDHGKTELSMRVVTGKPNTPTPTFSDTMETVVFSPYWHVPPSILANEVRPKLRSDPDYIARQNMELVRNGEAVDPYSVDPDDPALRVRQRPGAGNALGQVKFLFPNRFDVYLHDTPADALFARDARAFSHGCVRLEQPQALAEWMLGAQAPWTTDSIVAAMQSGNERHVALAQKVPVHIVYQTAWVDDDGTLRFVPDVYARDARQLALLDPPTNEMTSNLAVAELAP